MGKIKRKNLFVRTNKMYEPVTLFDIQRLIDLGRLDPTKIIDINALCNARLFEPADLLWSQDIMGIRLVAQGMVKRKLADLCLKL